MPSKKITKKPRKGKINLAELYEIKDLSKRFTVTKEDLKHAIKDIWNNCRDYEQLVQKMRGGKLSNQNG